MLHPIYGFIIFVILQSIVIGSAYFLTRILLTKFTKKFILKTEIILISILNYIVLILIAVIIPGLLGALHLWAVILCVLTEAAIILFFSIWKKNKCYHTLRDFPSFSNITGKGLQLFLKSAFLTSITILFVHAVFFYINEHDCLVFQNAITINFLNDKTLLLTNADLWYYPHNTELLFFFNLLPFQHLYYTSMQNFPFLISFLLLVYVLLRQIRVSRKTAVLGLVLASIFITAQEFSSSLLYKNDISLTTLFLYALFFLIRFFRTGKVFYIAFFLLSLGVMVSLKASGFVYALLLLILFVILLFVFLKKRITLLKNKKQLLVLLCIFIPLTGILNYQYIYNWLIMRDFLGSSILGNALSKTSAISSFFIKNDNLVNINAFLKYLILGGFSFANFTIFRIVQIKNKFAEQKMEFYFLLLITAIFIIPLFLPFSGPPNLLFLGSLRFWQPFFILSLTAFLYHAEKKKWGYGILAIFSLLTIAFIQNVIGAIIFKHGVNVKQYFVYLYRYFSFLFNGTPSYIYNHSANSVFSAPIFQLWIATFVLIWSFSFLKSKIKYLNLNRINSKLKIAAVITFLVALPFVFKTSKNYEFYRNNIFFFRLVQSRIIQPGNYQYNDAKQRSTFLDYLSDNIQKSNIFLFGKMETIFMWRFLINDKHFSNNTYSYRLHKPVNNGRENYVIVMKDEIEKFLSNEKHKNLVFNNSMFHIYKLN